MVSVYCSVYSCCNTCEVTVKKKTKKKNSINSNKHDWVFILCFQTKHGNMLNFRLVKSYSSFRAAVKRELWLKQNVLTKQKELCHASSSQVWVSNIFPDAENHGLQSAKRLNNSCSLTEHCETCREERLNAFQKTSL